MNGCKGMIAKKLYGKKKGKKVVDTDKDGN